MTGSSSARRERRQRGRPPRDDELVIDAARALRIIFGLGPQRARDLAIALMEGHEIGPSRRPRARRPNDWTLTGFNLGVSVERRSRHLKEKWDKEPVRAEVVLALVLAIRGRDESLIRQLLILAGLSPAMMKQTVKRLIGEE
jgi:hypothetical protein